MKHNFSADYKKQTFFAFAFLFSLVFDIKKHHLFIVVSSPNEYLNSWSS